MGEIGTDKAEQESCKYSDSIESLTKNLEVDGQKVDQYQGSRVKLIRIEADLYKHSFQLRDTAREAMKAGARLRGNEDGELQERVAAVRQVLQGKKEVTQGRLAEIDKALAEVDKLFDAMDSRGYYAEKNAAKFGVDQAKSTGAKGGYPQKVDAVESRDSNASFGVTASMKEDAEMSSAIRMAAKWHKSVFRKKNANLQRLAATNNFLGGIEKKAVQDKHMAAIGMQHKCLKSYMKRQSVMPRSSSQPPGDGSGQRLEAYLVRIGKLMDRVAEGKGGPMQRAAEVNLVELFEKTQSFLIEELTKQNKEKEDLQLFMGPNCDRIVRFRAFVEDIEQRTILDAARIDRCHRACHLADQMIATLGMGKFMRAKLATRKPKMDASGKLVVEPLTEEEAAIRIQAFWRGEVGREKVWMMLNDRYGCFIREVGKAAQRSDLEAKSKAQQQNGGIVVRYATRSSLSMTTDDIEIF
eukprot:TRINITY_DN55664_c0_g1_i1.p1 TRINITY_DN55664_c0_g1~~TRINITY_DN55664_c0_g1_i1.p1  ORF type:complete len:468 (-),score=103.94 TRINITY_DN55664_c0_g1_i1:141-1544(-)